MTAERPKLMRTAPKDGRRIIVWVPIRRRWKESRYSNGKWVDISIWGERDVMHPTHWVRNWDAADMAHRYSSLFTVR